MQCAGHQHPLHALSGHCRQISTAPHATAVRRNGRSNGTAGRRRRLRTSTIPTGTATASTAAPLNGRDSEATPA